MEHRQSPITLAARILIAVIGLFWLVLGGISLWRTASSTTLSPTALVIIAILMFGNALVLLIIGWLLQPGRRLLYIAALAVIVLNIILTFTDQFGLFDLLTLLIDLAILGLLLISRRVYLPGGQKQAGQR